MKGFQSERGQGLVEYALILVFIAIIVIVGVTALGTKTTSMFDDVNSELITMVINML